MNWKAHFLVKVAAIYLAVPFTLMLVVVKSHSSNANSELQQSNDLKAQSLPLGKLNQPQSRQSAQIAPGLTHTVIVKGEKSERDFYTVDVAFSADLSAANATAESLRSNGYQPRIQTVKNRVPDDLELSVLGYLVRAGAFATEAEAINLREQLAAAGYLGLRVVYTGED